MGHYAIFILAYFLGAIPFAYFAGRLKNIDIRQHGSGNMGTTNAFRLLGAKLGIAVLIGDALKGALAAGLSYWVFKGENGALNAQFPYWAGIIGGLLAMAGHSWNPFFGFRPSGKGVAAGLGIIAVLMLKITLLAVLVFLIVVILTRYVSMGSVAAGFTVAISVLFIFPDQPVAYKFFGLIGPLVVIIRHRTNFKRVLNGTEHRFGEKKIT